MIIQSLNYLVIINKLDNFTTLFFKILKKKLKILFFWSIINNSMRKFYPKFKISLELKKNNEA